MVGSIIVVILLSLLVYYLYKNTLRTPPNFPTGPPSLPGYGAYPIVRAYDYNNLARALQKLSAKYKTKLLGLYFGNFRTVVVHDPQLIKEMLYKEELDGRVDVILFRLRSYWKKLGIFFTDGYFWHTQRRFSLRFMRDYGFGRRDEVLEDVIANEIREMIDMRMNGPKYLAEKELVRGELVYLPYYFAVPFINGLCHVLVRVTFPRAKYDILWRLARGALKFQRNSDDFGGALSLAPWLKDVAPNWSGYKALCEGNQVLLDFFSKMIMDAMAIQDDSYDRHFLDMYIRKMKEERNTKEKTTYSEHQLELICTDYMFPTASAVQAVLTILVEQILLQPELQDRIHDEIDRVVGRDRMPTLDDRKNMPLTEACLREAMRYETLVPLGILHRSMTNTTFSGYDIPEDTIFAANYVSLHMDKTIWGDPENFRPDRFIVDGKLDVSRDKSLPFGAGRRLCAGETYARQTMFQVFSALMQAFHVTTADGKLLEKPAPRIQGVITTIPNFWVRLKSRYE